MTDRQIRKLSKTELIEILHEQEQVIETLTAENEQLQEMRIDIEQLGSLAEASAVVGGISQAAQKAADVYLCNIKRLEDEKKEAVDAAKAEIRVELNEMFNETERKANDLLKQMEERMLEAHSVFLVLSRHCAKISHARYEFRNNNAILQGSGDGMPSI
jgi:uncharacterized phage infection (PIP) family protein YhgE